MNNKKTQFHTLTQSVSLSPAEKSIMKAEMLREMRKPSSSFSYRMMFLYVRNHVTAFALVVLVFSSTTTSVLAHKAIPGDMLYAVKTKLNEPIESLFATSEYEKAEWSVTLATRRLEEAKILEEKRDVPEEVKVRHKQILDEQIEIANARTTPFKDDDEEEYGGALAMNARMSLDNTEDTNQEEVPEVALFSAMKMSDPSQDSMNATVAVEATVLDEENPETRIRNAILLIEQKIIDAKTQKLPKEKLLRLYARKVKLESELMALSRMSVEIDTRDEEMIPTMEAPRTDLEYPTTSASSTLPETILPVDLIQGEVRGEYDREESSRMDDDSLEGKEESRAEPIRTLLRGIR